MAKPPPPPSTRRTAKAKLHWNEAPAPKLSATAALAKSRELRRQGRFVEALAILRDLEKTAPATAAFEEELARVHGAMGDPDGAAEAYRRAIELNPRGGDNLYRLAAILIERKRPDEARQIADRLLALEPDKSRGHATLGLALRAAGRIEEAVPHLEAAIAIAPADFTTMNALMLALHRLGRIEEARARGLAAMVLKDRHACAEFAKSPLASLALNRRLPPFDHARPARNVIAFSLWGDRPDYTHGAIVNAQIGPHIYKGWTCRFYCDDSVPRPILNELRRLKAQVIEVPEANRVASGAFWRFQPSDDPDVDRFLCRDCDSRLNCREKAAVDAWIASDRPFHVMRDHIFHNELILAGMWGGVAGVLPNLEALSRQGHRFSGVRHADQNFLRLVVWPLIKADVLNHDSQYRFAGSHDFPESCRLPPNLHVGWGERGLPPWSPR